MNYIEGLVNLIEELINGKELAVNFSHLRGELSAVYAMGFVSREEYGKLHGELLMLERKANEAD